MLSSERRETNFLSNSLIREDFREDFVHSVHATASRMGIETCEILV